MYFARSVRSNARLAALAVILLAPIVACAANDSNAGSGDDPQTSVSDIVKVDAADSGTSKADETVTLHDTATGAYSNTVPDHAHQSLSGSSRDDVLTLPSAGSTATPVETPTAGWQPPFGASDSTTASIQQTAGAGVISVTPESDSEPGVRLIPRPNAIVLGVCALGVIGLFRFVRRRRAATAMIPKSPRREIL